MIDNKDSAIKYMNMLMDNAENALDNKIMISIKDYINQLEADKMELSKAVVDVFKIQRKNYGHSMDLHLDMITFAEDIKPLVLKAEKYIKENK